jgi:hypothetical protein
MVSGGSRQVGEVRPEESPSWPFGTGGRSVARLLGDVRRGRTQLAQILRGLSALSAPDESQLYDQILELLASELEYDRGAILVPTDRRMAATFAVASAFGVEGAALGMLFAARFRRSEIEAEVPPALDAVGFLVCRVRPHLRPERILVIGRSSWLSEAIERPGEADRLVFELLASPVAAVVDHHLAMADVREELARLQAANAELRARLDSFAARTDP